MLTLMDLPRSRQGWTDVDAAGPVSREEILVVDEGLVAVHDDARALGGVAELEDIQEKII